MEKNEWKKIRKEKIIIKYSEKTRKQKLIEKNILENKLIKNYKILKKSEKKGEHKYFICANIIMIKHVNKTNFEGEVLNSQKTILVDFFATWCGPCQMLGPILEKIGNSRADFDIAKIDIDDAQELAIKYGIEVVPTMIIFKQGRPVETITGLLNAEEIVSKVSKYI